MPQTIIDIIGKMKTREIQLCLAIISVCFITGGAGWKALAERIDSIEERQQKQQLEQAKFQAEFKEISKKIDVIHNHVLQKGLEARSHAPAIRAN